MEELIGLVLRVAGAAAVDLGIALARAIQGGDASAVEALTKTCPTGDQIVASALVLKRQKELEAERYFAALTTGAADAPAPTLDELTLDEHIAFKALRDLDASGRLRVLKTLVQPSPEA